MARQIVAEKLAPTQIPDFAGAAAQYSNYIDPRQASISDAYTKRMSQIADMRSVTPEQMLSISSHPNAVTASLGFQDPTQLGGMLPDEYMAMLGPKETPSQILNRQLQLADHVTNMPERRKLLADAASKENAGLTHNLHNTAAYAGQSDLARNKEFTDIAKTNISNQLATDQHNISNSFSEQQISLHKQQLAQSYKIHKENFDQKEREIKLMSSGGAGGNGFSNPDLHAKFRNEADKFFDPKNNKDPLKGHVTDYLMNDLMARVYSGTTQNGESVDLTKGGAIKGYRVQGDPNFYTAGKFLVPSANTGLKPGWYGETVVNGKPYRRLIIETPLVNSGKRGGQTVIPSHLPMAQ